jgi:hypothetical protein
MPDVLGLRVTQPQLQTTGNGKPRSRSSQNVVERVGVFEGGKNRIMNQKEADGEALAEETGILAVFRPKQSIQERLLDTTLKHQREPTYCARVEPNSRCFCGFTFIEHPAEARLGGSSGDGFAWKRSLGKKRGGNAGVDGGILDVPCSRFRYMPASPAQTSAQVACQDAFRAARGADAASLHRGWYAKCRNCQHGHQDHDPETETCPLAYNEQVGNGKYQSGWECVVCNRRWEDHETVFLSALESQGGDAVCAVCPDRSNPRALARETALRNSASAAGPRAQGPTSLESGFMGERAAEVEQILQENSYGLAGNHKDTDHYSFFNSYADTQRFQHQIQLENARIRMQMEEAKRRATAGGSNSMTFVDTTTAYKEGKGSLYGFGVGGERELFDSWGRPIPEMPTPAPGPPLPPQTWLGPAAKRAEPRSRTAEPRPRGRSAEPAARHVRFPSVDEADRVWRDTLRRRV